MKFLPTCRLSHLAAVMLLVAVSAKAQIIDAPDGNVAGIPANYTEAKTGAYTLPDPLVLADGKPVADAQAWFEKRRPEILRLFEENQFGRCPERPQDMTFEVFDSGTLVFGGKAIRRQVTIYFSKDKFGPKMDLLLYLPTAAQHPVPVLLNASFTANSLTVDDPGVKVGEVWNAALQKRVPAAPGVRRRGTLNVLPVLGLGIGIATVNYADIDPDAPGAIAQGVRALYLKSGESEPAPDEWGSIAAWSWGLSRALDYLETDLRVDSNRVGLMGVSRLGKTVLWTAARDPRFALVIASCSGEGGAALSRRIYGETVAHLVAPTRYPYQFARNYQKWSNRANEAPFDAHLLIALVAPRAVLLQTGNTDRWSDPYGEFLAAKAATPVFHLLGEKGIEEYALPPAGQPMMNQLGYFMHAGGHGTVPADWDVFLNYLKVHLAPDS